MRIYVIVRQWQEDYDVEVKTALSLDAAIKIANEFVDDMDGYAPVFYGDDTNPYFIGEDFKEYADQSGFGDYHVRIWIEESEAC